MQCEGWRRMGGAFTFGPVKWEQCENDAVVEITATQDGETKKFPACIECWNEAIERDIEINSCVPLT